MMEFGVLLLRMVISEANHPGTYLRVTDMETQTLGSLNAWIRGGLIWGLIPSSGVD